MLELGVYLSASQPRLSKDNAHTKTLCYTMKYNQCYPLRRFRDLLTVRAWVDGLAALYNTVRSAVASYTLHQNSGIAAKQMRSVQSASRLTSRLFFLILSGGPRTLAFSHSLKPKKTILDRSKLVLPEPNKPRPLRLSKVVPTERHWQHIRLRADRLNLR